MLKETEEFLRKIKAGEQHRKSNSLKNRFKRWFKKNKKTIKYIFLFLIISLCLFYPTFVAGLIGNWIVDFVGTIVSIIKTGF